MSSRDPLHIRFAYALAGARVLPVSGPAHPLEREASRYVLIGAIISLTIGISGFAFFQWWTHREPEDLGDREVQIVRYTELGVPPSIDRGRSEVSVAQQVAMAAPPTIAVPEPVPDELAMDQTIMTAEEIDLALAAIQQADLGDLGDVQVVGGVPIQQQQKEDTSFRDPVNVLPQRISMKPPVYPEMARMSGIEGVVMLNVLVSTEGKVINVKVVDGPALLRDAAIAAAKTAVFKPATTDGRPVKVWVAMPLRFKMGN